MRLALATPVLATLALIGLTRAAWPLTPELFPQITLRGGEAQVVPDTGVTLLVTRVDDSRCPAEVDCFWEGMMRIELTVSTVTSKQAVVLCNLCDDGRDLASAAGLTFGLVGLAPSTDDLAKLGRPPELADYVVTLNWSKAE